MQKWKCNTNITSTFKKEEDYMRQILMANAFEAWTAAIRYCNDIKNGKATIQYQKNFVSSLSAIPILAKPKSIPIVFIYIFYQILEEM